MARPDRALPRAINTAMAVVIVCFEITNVSYYILVPWESLSSNDAVAVVRTPVSRPLDRPPSPPANPAQAAAKYLLGPHAGAAISVLVALSCAGALNGNVFVTGRITAAAAKHGYFPSFLGERAKLAWPGLAHGVRRSWSALRSRPAAAGYAAVSAASPDDDDDCLATAPTTTSSSDDPPVNALLLTFAITTVYILVGSFRLFVTLIGIVEYTFFFLTIAGLLVLRVREPLRPRPFRPPLFVPAVFCLVSFSLVLRTMIHVPLQAAFFALLLAASLLLRKFSQ